MEARTLELYSGPYRNPFFAIEKKNGKLRIIVDCQKLNGYTKRDVNALPNLDEFLERFVGKKILSVLDFFLRYD